MYIMVTFSNFNFPIRFHNEDLEWSLKAASAGLRLIRYENISIARKFIPSSLHEEDKYLTEKATQLVTVVDSELNNSLPFHPGRLLEKYLMTNSSSIFPQAKCNPSNPVLCVNCYMSLGNEVRDCCENYITPSFKSIC